MHEIINYLKFKEDMELLLRNYPARKWSNKVFMQQHKHLIDDLKKYYRLIFIDSLNIGTCSNCIVDAFIELRNLTLYEIMEKLQIKHRLKKGKVINLNGVFYSYRSKHLTNEVCQAIFDKWGMFYFDYFDENWKDSYQNIDLSDVNGGLNSETLKEYFNGFDAKDKEQEQEQEQEQDPEQIEKINTEAEIVDLRSMKINELRAYAKEKNIEIKGRVRADIIWQIQNYKE